VEILEAIDAHVRAKAKERQSEAGPKEGRGKKKSAGGNFPQAVEGKSRDLIAARVGWSGRTYEKAKMVVEAAKDNPHVYGPLVDKMDTTGKVHGTWKRLPTERRV